MKQSNTIIDNLIQMINNDLDSEYTFSAIRAFEVKSLPIPVKEIYLSFTPESHSVSFFDNENSEYCEKNEIIIRMNCFSPLNYPPYTCHSIAETVLDFISDNYPESVISYSTGTTEYDSDTRAYKLTCLITFSFEECAGEGASSDPIATPKNFFCKTHVRDTDIHLNDYERELLTEAFVTGTYTGTNQTQEIVVGFTPRFVIIYPVSVPVVTLDSTASKTINYIGLGFRGGYTKAISANQIGFTVKNVTDTRGNSRLNEQGVTYAYIAFK